MVPEFRRIYNARYSEDTYRAFLASLNREGGNTLDFRVAETPVFLPEEFKQRLLEAGNQVLAQLQQPGFFDKLAGAVPQHYRVPGETARPEFLQVDFAVCADQEGTLVPQLIELQGFPSVYCYQALLARKFREFFFVPAGWTSYFGALDEAGYLQLLQEVIVGPHDPRQVILLEFQPEKQKTRIDFYCTQKMLGVKPVCVTQVMQRGTQLFYREGGKKIPIRRIYYRSIFDEMERAGLPIPGFFFAELDVEWVPHPNWYFKLSKFTLPLLQSPYVPEAYFLHQLERYPEDLENFVLKPLYSFAGSGVLVDIDAGILDRITDRENYILQRKVAYHPVVETLDEKARVEIRLMYVWRDRPELVHNLARLSKGKMMGVDYNKNKTWVGASVAFHSGH
ncbi:MAG: hypothetical protein D6715_03570 [Calditrichaeota bacterium]|nr:MAG: hypothetical protein D6715_03570 [Calditrichota bacterium]